MFKADNSFNLAIGKSISRTSSVQALDSSNATTFLANGEVLVVDKNGSALTPGQTIADSEWIQIVQGRGTANPAVFSNKIFGANVTSFTGRSYVAPAEQITYIGYNGTSGNIEALSDNKYILHLIFKHDTANWSEQSNTIHNEYDSDASATSSEVAQAFVRKFNTNYPALNSDIIVERVNDGTFTVLGGSSTLDVTNGSPTATASSASHGLVAGDVIRIGGTATTIPVYIVSAVSGVTITLDTNYTGTTATVANANVGELSSIANWGLKITGKALTFSTGLFKYLKVAFDTTIKNFGTTTITESQAANRGSGTYEEVAEIEYFARGFDGWLSTRNSIPAVAQPTTDATSGAVYDFISIAAFNSQDFSTITGSKPAPFNVFIAMVDGAAQTTNLLAQLNPWMASTPRNFSNVAV